MSIKAASTGHVAVGPPSKSIQGPGTIEGSGLFRSWTDRISGVQSWILSRRVAPMQMSFYFTNPSFTSDERYYWFYCCFPPGGRNGNGWQLGVVDFCEGSVHLYPETMFLDASPYVDAITGEAYWTTGLEVWKRGPRPDDAASLVGSFPTALANNRRPRRIATHLTRSADGKSFGIDAEFSPQWFVGDLLLSGAEARIWNTFDRCYNHAQFSPTDPDLLLIAQDGWHDAATGAKGDCEDRLWLLRRGEEARPIFPDSPSNMRGHEWWDADGEHVWYIDYRKGTEKVNILTGKFLNVWPAGHTHSHSDRSGRFLVGDINTGPDQWRLAFYNIETGVELPIVSSYPVYPSRAPGTALSARTLGYDRTQYHVHPHPQFCCNDRYIAYTTNVFGNIDVALVSVEQLIALSS